MAIPSVRTASGAHLPRCGAGMAPWVCHHGLTLVSFQAVSSGEGGGLTMAGPCEGLTAIAKSKPTTEKTTNGRLPELSNFESPPAEPRVSLAYNYPLPAGTAPRILSARSFNLWTP